MKIFPLLSCITLLLSFSFKAEAISYEVIGACSPTPLYKGLKEINILNETAGSASIAFFDLQKIPYIGTESGFNSIDNSPIGMDSIEVISDTKMRAYGWCYSVNGFIPEVLPESYKFQSNNEQLVWFFAYSTYDKGQWIDYCVPSYKIAYKKFCSK